MSPFGFRARDNQQLDNSQWRTKTKKSELLEGTVIEFNFYFKSTRAMRDHCFFLRTLEVREFVLPNLGKKSFKIRRKTNRD